MPLLLISLVASLWPLNSLQCSPMLAWSMEAGVLWHIWE